MAEDFRIRVHIEEQGGLAALGGRLKTRDLAREVSRDVGDKVAVSHDGPELFLYAGTEEALRGAERVLRADLEQHDVQATVELARWHDDAEDWEPLDAALPQTDEEREAERARLMEREDRETAAQGYATWEVRVTLHSRHDARELETRLEREGVQSVRRWKYLVIEQPDEDAARGLADRLQGELPAGAEATVEGTFASAQRSNPFSFFGAGTGGP